MIEKAYKTMGISGIIGFVIGIGLIVTGIAAGVTLVITSVKLYNTKNGLTF